MTIDEMRERKREYGYTCDTIAKLSGVPLGTVQKIFSGETTNPRQETIEKLVRVLQPKFFEYSFENNKAEDCFKDADANYGNSLKDHTLPEKNEIIKCKSIECINGITAGQAADGIGADCFHEAIPAYKVKQQGEYTLEDYYAWPEEQRVELIDGCIYDMGAPYNFHQLIVGEIYRQISNYIHENKGQCIPLLSPVDVQLDRDEKTMVQPDVGILCDRSKFIKRCVYGAPDFMVEVISPSSSKRDQVIKLNKYLNAGVREYWVVDYKNRQVFVYFFESDELVKIYPIGSPVPVNIYNGELVIYFDEIKEYIDEYAPDRKDIE